MTEQSNNTFNQQSVFEVKTLNNINLPRKYNNQFKGAGRIIYLIPIAVLSMCIVACLVPGQADSNTLILWLILLVIVIYMLKRRKLIVNEKGIIIYYLLHKKKLEWNNIQTIGFNVNDFLNAPVIVTKDGKQHRITQAFKMSFRRAYAGYGMNIIVTNDDVINTEVMNELQSLFLQQVNSQSQQV